MTEAGNGAAYPGSKGLKTATVDIWGMVDELEDCVVAGSWMSDDELVDAAAAPRARTVERRVEVKCMLDDQGMRRSRRAVVAIGTYSLLSKKKEKTTVCVDCITSFYDSPSLHTRLVLKSTVHHDLWLGSSAHGCGLGSLRSYKVWRTDKQNTDWDVRTKKLVTESDAPIGEETTGGVGQRSDGSGRMRKRR